VGQFEIYQDGQRQYRWRLRAENGEVIADGSEGYVSRADCEHGIELVKRLAPGAPIEAQVS
jgi:uncharacterized protein YegP (UPF0339 family)